MDETALLNMLKAMVEDENDDSILLTYLGLAKRAILNRLYPFVLDKSELDVPDRYQSLQVEVAAYMLNKRGAEGEIQHIENGIHRNYEAAGIPKSLLEEVTPMCATLG